MAQQGKCEEKYRHGRVSGNRKAGGHIRVRSNYVVIEKRDTGTAGRCCAHIFFALTLLCLHPAFRLLLTLLFP